MPIDPHAPDPQTPEARVADRLSRIERRLRVLEGSAPSIGAGTPAPAGTPRDGTAYAQDSGTGFLWLRVGGVWRKVGLA